MNNVNFSTIVITDNRKLHHKDIKRNRLNTHTPLKTLLLFFDPQKATDCLKAKLLCISKSWTP